MKNSELGHRCFPSMPCRRRPLSSNTRQRNNDHYNRIQVESMDEVSARIRAGRRCYERILLCELHCFWNWPPDGSWLDGLQPSSVGRQVPTSCSFYRGSSHSRSIAKLHCCLSGSAPKDDMLSAHLSLGLHERDSLPSLLYVCSSGDSMNK